MAAPGLRSYGYSQNTGSGTSFAAPHVAGTAALVRGLRPDLSQEAIYELIRHSADDVGELGFDTFTGWGRLNAYRAVSDAIAGLRLDLVADPPTVRPGGQTAVRLRITAPSGVAAGRGARTAFTASLGAFAPITVTADNRGEAVAHFVAGELPGTAHITATLGSLTATVPITIATGKTIYLPLVSQ